MICGDHLLSPTGETVAICKREPHEDEWHEVLCVFVDHEKEMIDVKWRKSWLKIGGNPDGS